MDAGLLLLRVVVGLLFLGHGTQKLFGWFGGGGIKGSQGYFQSLGYPPAMAILAGMAETGGGTLLALGWVTPLAAAAITVVMVNVIGVKWSHGLWEVKEGFEYPLTVVAVMALFALGGPGAYSIDWLLGWHLAGLGTGAAALAAAFLVAAGSRAVRRQAAPAGAGQPH